jgi:hypothetical protein
MPSKIPDRSEETTEKEETQAQPEKEKTSEYRPESVEPVIAVGS